MLGQSHMNIFALFLAAIVSFTGCKRRTPAPAASPTPAPAQPAEPAKEPVAKSAPAAGGSGRIVMGDANLPALNSALKAYVDKFKKPPAKLDDLAKEGFVPFVPFAPPGSRYELDAARAEVKLVNSTAK